MPTASSNPIIEEIVTLITIVAGLFATQGLIANGTSKLITGIAAAAVPLAILVVRKLTHAKVKAAVIVAAAPPSQLPSPIVNVKAVLPGPKTTGNVPELPVQPQPPGA